MRKDYDIVGSYNNQRISNIDAERTVNLFEYVDPNGKRKNSLLSTSGLIDQHLAVGSETGGSRATFVYNNMTMFQVFGGSIYQITKISNDLITTKIGTLRTDSGYVGIDANTYQIIFVDGQDGYIWDTQAQKFQEILDPSFPDKPIDVSYLDGFFIVANGDTNNFQLSMFDQGLVWGPGTENVVSVDTAADTLELASTNSFQTGIEVTFSGSSLPNPLVADTNYWVIRLSDTLIQVATSYDNAITGIYIDLISSGTGTITIDNAGQLQEGAITTHPGNIVACKTLHRRLFLFSQNFTEVWENAGIGTNLPFRRNNSLLMEVGTPAIGSVVVGFDSMFFLSQDKDGLGSVMEVQGTESMPVSNRALDYQLAQYAATTGISDARGILIKENGIIFYRLNFTASNHTFVYNVSMSNPQEGVVRWHEEEVLNGDRHPAQTHGYFFGINYYGAYNSSTFYAVSPTTTTNAGEDIRRMRIGRPICPEGYNRIRVDRFQLDVVQGQNNDVVFEVDEVLILLENGKDWLTTENDINIITEEDVSVSSGDHPIVFLSISKDGGQSYGYRQEANMGKIGERTYRTVWRKLGTIPRGQAFVPKIEFFNEIPFTILGAAWDFEVMPE